MVIFLNKLFTLEYIQIYQKVSKAIQSFHLSSTHFQLLILSSYIITVVKAKTANITINWILDSTWLFLIECQIFLMIDCKDDLKPWVLIFLSPVRINFFFFWLAASSGEDHLIPHGNRNHLNRDPSHPEADPVLINPCLLVLPFGVPTKTVVSLSQVLPPCWAMNSLCFPSIYVSLSKALSSFSAFQTPLSLSELVISLSEEVVSEIHILPPLASFF